MLTCGSLESLYSNHSLCMNRILESGNSSSQRPVEQPCIPALSNMVAANHTQLLTFKFKIVKNSVPFILDTFKMFSSNAWLQVTMLDNAVTQHFHYHRKVPLDRGILDIELHLEEEPLPPTKEDSAVSFD